MSISYAVFCLNLRPPSSTLFPYPTLFRSSTWRLPPRRTGRGSCANQRRVARLRHALPQSTSVMTAGVPAATERNSWRVHPGQHPTTRETWRSEEHTSELQSHVNLVCRLLLESPPTEFYTLSLPDALPIFDLATAASADWPWFMCQSAASSSATPRIAAVDIGDDSWRACSN